MRLLSVRIENYRCLEDVTVHLDDLTVLVGANGSGKSTVLRGLDWFFNGGDLEDDDVYRHQQDTVVRVSATFGEFTHQDREALGSYAGGETAIFSRTWSLAEGDKLTGRAFTFPPFEQIRAVVGALPRRNAYHELVDAEPGLGLPRVRNQDELAAAMLTFEQGHPGLLEPAESDATHLFGFVGGAKLNGRFAFVFVPAVSDAHEQLAGARGSLLSRLLERAPSDDRTISEQLDALQSDTQEKANELLREQHPEGLTNLSGRITEAMREFVPDAEVTVEVHPPTVRVSSPAFEVHVADDGVSTDVAHQGHGFQRALIMATLNELARAEEEGDVPAVLLAIEEPELYQHPLQARHFATVLAGLPRNGEGAFQVVYATHSQFFIDPAHYERLRRFSRRRADGVRIVTVASVEAVAERLDGILERDRIPQRIRLTLDRQIAEAVFAEVVVLVEGKTDAGLLSGIADRDGGFEAQGVAVVNVDGKAKIAVAAAVLSELGIPTYIVFDADRGKEARLTARAGEDAERLALIPDEIRNTITQNRALLRLVGADEVDWPNSSVGANYAVFADRIEDIWPRAMEKAKRIAASENDDRKREQWYREAARTLDDDPPPLLTQIIEAVRRLR
jgi:putative ATP-dependent endonuclease of OLD family